MNFYDFFYFLVTGSEAWEPHYHQNFFYAQKGFALGFWGALIIGAIVACIFYFGFCNSSKTGKSANIGVWTIFLGLCAVISYFYADLVVIGDSKTTDNNSVFRAYSFYKANDYYLVEKSIGASPTMIEDLTKTHNQIRYDLDKGGDVRFDFDITTAVLAAISFFLMSLFVKRFTINGKTIPF